MKLLVGLLICCWLSLTQGFVNVIKVPIESKGSSSLLRSKQSVKQLYAVQVSRIKNTGEAEAITDFFVSNFWDQPITKEKQKQQLMSEVYKDLTTRYISNKSGGAKSALLVAKEGGRIVGCTGLETRTVRGGQVTKFEPVKAQAPPGSSIFPVLANLAVDRCARRKGIAQSLLKESEKVVRGWGYQELWLVVDEKNKPARALYEKFGYELVSRDPRGSKVVPTEWQLKEVPVTNLCMSKSLLSTAPSPTLGLSSLFPFLRRT